MNCFQFFIFVTSGTTCARAIKTSSRLWIAFNFLSLWRQEQHIRQRQLRWGVVNCFQFFIFVTSGTTIEANTALSVSLWIAFNFLSLWRQEQHRSLQCFGGESCELLSIFYLCDVRNNWAGQLPTLPAVVNCFQFFIFVTSGTTKRQQDILADKLWIAFNFLSLWRQEQPGRRSLADCSRCELLSIFYLCDVRNNKHKKSTHKFFVVNCFQFFIFVTSGTTAAYLRLVNGLLWIAFNFLSLWRQEQHLQHNQQHKAVVNCFQFFIFVTSGTTHINFTVWKIALWIAFNFLSLWRQEQLRRSPLFDWVCCELLSIFYLCDVRNNKPNLHPLRRSVVNCFQFFIFVTSGTTGLARLRCRHVLWIAFNFLSLWRQEQLFL